MSDQIQSPDTIGPMVDQQPKEDPALNDPAKMDYKQGREFFKQGEYNQAAYALANALRGFEEQGDQAGVANAEDRLGDVCMAKQEFQLALDHFQRAYEICKKEEDSFSILALNKKIAVARRMLGQLAETLDTLFDIIDHYHLMKDPKGIVETMELVVAVYLEQGENVKAADTCRTIASIHRNFNHQVLAEKFESQALQLEQG